MTGGAATAHHGDRPRSRFGEDSPGTQAERPRPSTRPQTFRPRFAAPSTEMETENAEGDEELRAQLEATERARVEAESEMAAPVA